MTVDDYIDELAKEYADSEGQAVDDSARRRSGKRPIMTWLTPAQVAALLP